MIEQQLIWNIIDSLQSLSGVVGTTECDNLLISSVNGTTVTIDPSTPVTQLSNNWKFCILEVMLSSTALYSRVIVNNVAGQNIDILFGYKGRTPQKGDLVKLWGGPLSQSKWISGDPDNISQIIKSPSNPNGVPFFGTLKCEVLALENKGLTRTRSALEGARFAYSFEGTVEMPLQTGGVDVATVAKASQDLPSFAHQTLATIFLYRYGESAGIMPVGDMSCEYMTLQRPGDTILKAGVFDFVIETA